MKLRIKKLSSAQDLPLPSYHNEGDAGLDIRTVEEVTIKPGSIKGVKTGLCLQIPKGYVGLIWEKSGLAFKHNIKTCAGVIDSGYRGEVKVALLNAGNEPYTFDRGDKVAQMLIQKVGQPEIVEVDELDNSERGGEGFGSTGK